MFPSNNSPSEEGITISKRQASILIALFLLLALSVFIIGYFLGKKRDESDYLRIFSTKRNRKSDR